jgi:HPt (histidine-containing phosphotransfer) domain-containing protein
MARSMDSGQVAFAGDGPRHPWLPRLEGGAGPYWRSPAPTQSGSPVYETLPLFDAATLSDLCGGIEPDTLASILSGFMEDLRHRLDRIAAATGAATTPNLRVLAFESHALSSCSYTFGALRLAGVCRSIEQAVGDGDSREALFLARSLGRIGAESLDALSARHRAS